MMEITKRYRGVWRYIKARWPTYLFGFGGGFLAGIVLLWVSILQEWFSFTFLTTAILVILVYFFISSLWSAHQLYDTTRISDMLVKLGGLTSTENVVHIELGERWPVRELSRQFTTGHVDVIDVYNPIITPDKTLARLRQNASRPPSDPRISWRDGRIDLLPLPDDSATLVTEIEGLSKFWQKGDQAQLLREISRILKPEGHIIMAERTRTLSNLLTLGIAGFRLPTADYWVEILLNNGFEMVKQSSIQDLITFFRARKQQPPPEKRLSQRAGH